MRGHQARPLYVCDGQSHLIDFQVNDRARRIRQRAEARCAGDRQGDRPGGGASRPDDLGRGPRDSRPPLDQKPYWDLERPASARRERCPSKSSSTASPVAKTEITADGSVEGVSFDVPIKKSSWVALRIYPSSHTNPVFVTVGGKPIRASKKSAEWCLKSVDQCWSKKEPAIRTSEKEAAKKAFDVAREAYKKILAECEAD